MKQKSFLCLHDALINIDQISIVESRYDDDDQPAIRITYGNRSETDYYQDYFETEAERDEQFKLITKELGDPITDEFCNRIFLRMPDALIKISTILSVYKYDQMKGFAIKIELTTFDPGNDYWYYYDTENDRDQDFERIKNDIMTAVALLSGFYVADGSENIKDGKPVFNRRPITEYTEKEFVKQKENSQMQE